METIDGFSEANGADRPWAPEMPPNISIRICFVLGKTRILARITVQRAASSSWSIDKAENRHIFTVNCFSFGDPD
jgi:hypothetical protein